MPVSDLIPEVVRAIGNSDNPIIALIALLGLLAFGVIQTYYHSESVSIIVSNVFENLNIIVKAVATIGLALVIFLQGENGGGLLRFVVTCVFTFVVFRSGFILLNRQENDVRTPSD